MKTVCNMKTLCVIISSVFISALSLTSCQKGNQGIQGATGTTGATGATGAAGSTGASGNTILSGEGAPADSIGRIGDFYLELDNTQLYGPKTASGWGSGESLVGQSGAAGAQGETGAPGDPGAQGPAGPSGIGALVDTFSVSTTQWSVGGMAYAQIANGIAYGYPTQHVIRYNDIITQGVLDSGMVLVSFTPDQSFNATQYVNLPYIIAGYDPANDSVVNYNYSYVATVNKVTLQFYVTSTSNSDSPDVSTFTVPDARYKVVVIPAAVARMIDAVTNKKFTSQGRVITL